MTATDELRRLLDERGVEYKDRDVFGKHVFHWGKPFHRAMFTDAGEWTELVVENASPEQAVEATLGSDLQSENDKLREERDMYRDLVGCMVHPDVPDQLAAENDKLRELAKEACELARVFYDCGGTFNDLDDLLCEASELGIEVEV